MVSVFFFYSESLLPNELLAGERHALVLYLAVVMTTSYNTRPTTHNQRQIHKY